MRRLFCALGLIAVGLGLISWLPVAVASESSSLETDAMYTIVQDYWLTDHAGTGQLVYATGEIWYGTASPTGAIAAIDETAVGNLSWGNELDRRFIVFWNEGFGVWDLGETYSDVVLFPFIDHAEFSHAFTYAVYGSNDFNASNPWVATWMPARLDEIYVKGWSSAGQDQFGICNDDYVSVWNWPSTSEQGGGYRYIRVNAAPWPGHKATVFDAEVDAVKGVVPGQAQCGWQNSVIEKGRTFSYTSLKVGSDDRARIAYGGEQLYYAVRDGATWHVEEVDRYGVGTHCSLALDEFGRPAISYYDSVNSDLKYAHKNGSLNGVWGTSSSNVYAVGDGGTILHYNGVKWSPMASPTTQTLNGLFGLSADSIFAVGNGGTILRYNGSSWSTMSSGTSEALRGVWGSSSTDMFAVGDRGTILRYNGSAWSVMSSGPSETLRGVWGSSSTDVFAVGDGGTILRYDGSWSPAVSAGTFPTLRGVWGSSSTDVFAVGDGGTILRYNGTSWLRWSGSLDCLNSVWGNSSENVFAVGCRGAIVHYDGSSWSPMTSSTTYPLHAVWGNSSTDDVLAVGGEGAVIGHDGQIWSSVASSNGWLVETVDSSGDLGKHSSLAFDASGRPCISYYDATNGDLKYASWNGVEWDKRSVDSIGWVGEYTSLAFDNTGRPAISYYDATNENLKLAQWDGTCWVIDVVDASGDVGRYSSLAFDGSWNPAISYQDSTVGDLKCARWNGASWEIEVVDSQGWVGQYSSLAFGGVVVDNTTVLRPGISYYDVVNQDLKYARWNGTNWDVAAPNTAGNVGSYTSLDFDLSGNPVVSHYDATSDAVKVAGWKPWEWTIQTVDPFPWAGRFSSLAFDPADNAMVSFYDAREGDLKYARWQENKWILGTVDSYGDVGRYSSLAFDRSGNAGISYYEVSRGNLKFAHWNGAGWDISPLDSSGDVGSYSSLAYDLNGNPGVSYYDATNGDLKFCYRNGEDWIISVVDTAGDVGRFASLGFDLSGNPGISYYDAMNGDLKYAGWDGARWNIKVVDSLGDVGSYCSLEMDCQGKPAISYHDATNGDLKYAHWSGPVWEIQVVDSKGWVGLYTSLAFDDLKRPAISYHDATSGALKYAHWDGKAWVLENVDSKQAAGHLTSLAFDGCGSPVISYDSPITGDLKYASHANPSPNQPVNKLPISGSTYVSLTPTLECEAFADPCTDSHRASQWIVTTENCEINCSVVFDSGVDTSNLLKITIPEDALQPNTTYYWCVRHRDCHGAWSRYSAKSAFTTESPPQQPVGLLPESGAVRVSVTPTLTASDFSDPEVGDRHVASEWQITVNSGDYAKPLFAQKTQRSSLTRMNVPEGILANNTTYYWRVRYQDNHGTWSKFSVETSFSTNSAPDVPTNTYPANEALKVSVTPTLQASGFADADANETHHASQWRITKVAGDYSNPVFDSGTDTLNLTEITIESVELENGTTYYWQVRYQDSQGSWSSWSGETSFTTKGVPVVPAALIAAAAVVAVLAVVAITAPMVMSL